MQENDDNKPDLGWIVAFTLAGLFLIFVVLQFPSLREIACKVDEQDCFRQWVSALGGWAAVLAAVPTIYYLSKQIRTSTKQQRVNFAISIRNDTALVRTVKITGSEILQQVDNTKVAMTNAQMPRDARLSHLVAAIELLSDQLKRPALAEFEIRIAPASNVTVATLCQYIDSQLDDARRYQKVVYAMSDDDFRKKVDELMGAVRYAERYAIDALTAVQKYERDVIEHFESFS